MVNRVDHGDYAQALYVLLLTLSCSLISRMTWPEISSPGMLTCLRRLIIVTSVFLPIFEQTITRSVNIVFTLNNYVFTKWTFVFTECNTHEKKHYGFLQFFPDYGRFKSLTKCNISIVYVFLTWMGKSIFSSTPGTHDRYFFLHILFHLIAWCLKQ